MNGRDDLLHIIVESSYKKSIEKPSIPSKDWGTLRCSYRNTWGYSEKDIYYLLTTPPENVSCYTLNFCGYCAQRNLQARWQNKHNKMYSPFYLNESWELHNGKTWVTLLVWAVALLWLQPIPLEFTLDRVASQVLCKIPQCRDGCLHELRKTTSLLLTYRVNSIFHLQIITLRWFINVTVSSYSLFHLTTEVEFFSKLIYLLPYCNESQTYLFAQHLWDWIINLQQAF